MPACGSDDETAADVTAVGSAAGAELETALLGAELLGAELLLLEHPNMNATVATSLTVMSARIVLGSVGDN